MFFVRRKLPHGRVKLVDEDWEIDLSQVKGPDEFGYVVATKRLTDEEWLEPGELIVFRDGRVVYSSSGREEES